MPALYARSGEAELPDSAVREERPEHPPVDGVRSQSRLGEDRSTLEQRALASPARRTPLHIGARHPERAAASAAGHVQALDPAAEPERPTALGVAPQRSLRE